MDTERCRHLAERLHQLLLQQLGMGLDPQRMLNEPLYARDVLLVCAAHPGSELATLAWEYRDAAAPASRPASTRTPRSEAAPARTARPAGRFRAEPLPLSVAVPAEALSAEPAEAPDSEGETAPPRSPLSRFSRLSLSRFGASIFGGSLFEGTLFGSPKADPVTDFGDDSYLAPTPGRGQPRSAQAPAQPTAPRRARWFGR
jgi:hypothetical protein